MFDRLRITAFLVLALVVAACDGAPRVTGVVERVDHDYQQVTVTQPGIEGVLPEGTTTLAAADAVRAELEPGQIVEIAVGRGETSPEIKEARFVRWASEDDGWLLSAGRRVPLERAEPISLWDTDGELVSLDTLSGQVLLVDFIYTDCPGPCPAQTHNMRRVQRGLSERAKERVRLVSVTIDPETDDAETLGAYAAKHGADLSGWSFLTGPPAQVEATYNRYGIGITTGAGGSMDHTLRSYVIDDRGYLVDRYRSDHFDPAAVIERLEALAQEAAQRASG